MTAKIDMLTFDAGLVDDLVEARATALNHGRGCRRLTNFIALPQGPAIARPPSRLMGLAATKDGDGGLLPRLIRVTYDQLLSYQVEFGHGYCRFFTNDGQVLDGEAVYEIDSPYAATELAELVPFCDAGTLYLWHPDHPPYRLVYSAETAWVLEPTPFTWGPFLEANGTAVTIAADGGAGPVTLTATADVFLPGHIGARWMIGHRAPSAKLYKKFTLDGSSSSISVAFATSWRLDVTGTFDATLTLERSYDAEATWEPMNVYLAAATDEGLEQGDNASYRVTMSDWVSGTAYLNLIVDAHIHIGAVEITGVDPETPTEAEATVMQTLYSTDPTTIWAEGAWSPLRGYPRCGGLIENRLASAATIADPTTIWLSRSNGYTQMRTGAAPSDALTFTFTTGKGDPFLWISAEQTRWYVGTPSAVLQMQAADPSSALSRTNVATVVRRIDFGSAPIRPVRAHSTLILVDVSRLRPMKVTYDWEQDLLVAPPLTFQCPTLTAPGIKQICFQRGIVPMVWALRTDGVLLGMTYEQMFREDVIAWQITETGGTIDWIEPMPGTGGEQLWWSVDRDGVRCIERLDPLNLKPTRDGDHGLDSYVTFDGGAAQTIATLAIDADTGVVTAALTGHGYEDGDHVRIAASVQLPWLNGRVFDVADAADDTFTLKLAGGDYVDGRLLTEASGAAGTVCGVARTFTGAGHLNGVEVYAVGDGGRVLGPFTPAEGEADLGGWWNRVALGLFTEAWLQPLRIVLPTPAGSTRGRQMSVAGLWLSVYRSWECQIGRDADHLETLNFWGTETEINAPPELVTDDFYVTIEGGLTDDPTVLIRRSLPLPLCVRAMMLDTGIGGTRSTQP
ncbi:MAG TPA: hypothetical protein VM238_22950 [Phycisphaerae bacterium]|nr:hypothetical protein [Phycisphaerae bacterium]